MTTKLTKAQQRYLNALATGADLRPWNGYHRAAMRERLLAAGLIDRHPVRRATSQFFITAAGRAALRGAS